VQSYFASLGFEMPLYTNPAEYLLQLVNTDFAPDQVTAKQELDSMIAAWDKSTAIKETIREIEESAESKAALHDYLESGPNKLLIPITLTHRSVIKAYRDSIAYSIRLAMYIGLSKSYMPQTLRIYNNVIAAIMMGTVWLRLGEDQENIRSFLNVIVSNSSSSRLFVY
jgi:hypothetical protein